MLIPGRLACLPDSDSEPPTATPISHSNTDSYPKADHDVTLSPTLTLTVTDTRSYA